MSAPRHASSSPASQMLESKVRLTRFILMFEGVWRALLWPFVVTGLFLLVSLAGLWPLLQAPIHIALLALFALAGLASLAPLFRLNQPSRDEALRRLESASALDHRPATSSQDELSQSATPEQQALWKAHQSRLAQLFAKLHPGFPRPHLAKADPYAFRAALLLLLCVSFFYAGPQLQDRLTSPLRFTAAMEGAPFRLDAWVTPPLYTGKPPVILADGATTQGIRRITVPEKSLLAVRTNGGPSRASELRIRPADGGTATALTPESHEDGLAEYRMTITQNSIIEVVLPTHTVATWHFDLIRDTKPLIELSEEPSRTPRGALRFSYSVRDDYGVANAEARFALPGKSRTAKDQSDTQGADKSGPGATLVPPVIPLNLPRANSKSAENRIFKDLTAHPWAGLTVEMTLLARDQAGQEGRSPPYTLVLPSRKFTKPLAKAIVEQRRELVRNPDERADIAQALAALTIGAEHFIDDKVVYLGLRSAFWRLKNPRAENASASVVEQLWDIALRVEDGDLPEAEAALRAAQEQLRKALEEGAPDDEIQRRIAALRQALQKFLQAMAEKAQRNGNLAEMPEGLGQQRMLSAQDLEQMLKNIENLAKTGARELAQKMLSELQGLVERLQMGAMNQNSRSQQMMKSVEGLGNIIGEQQKLLDETFRRQRERDDRQRRGERQGREGRQGRQQGQFGQNGRQSQQFGQRGQQGQRGQGSEQGRNGRGQGGNGQGYSGQGEKRFGELTERQGALREKLDSILEQLRGFGTRTPDQLEGAARAMRDAEKALGDNNLNRATQQQTLALDKLRQGTQALAEQMLQAIASRNGRGNQGQKDPFGRPERSTGPDLGTSVQVPDEIDIQRAREILDELRNRLSDPSRPLLELDYLERLIRQF